MHYLKNGKQCGKKDGHKGIHRSVEAYKRRCQSAAQRNRDAEQDRQAARRRYWECPERCRANQRARWATPEGYSSHRQATMLYDWRRIGIIGITIARWDQMLADQDDRCAVCGRQFTVGPERFPELDHDHEITDSDNVRELLCKGCNTRVEFVENGQMEPTPSIARYLARWNVRRSLVLAA